MLNWNYFLYVFQYWVVLFAVILAVQTFSLAILQRRGGALVLHALVFAPAHVIAGRFMALALDF